MTTSTDRDWRPDSWRSHPIQQQPKYRDPAAVEAALARVRALPPLVAPGEVDTLRARLAAAQRGEAFLLQGGDCAERFQDCARAPIEAKLKILLQMSLVLTWGARIPTIRVARMAGQYAKPRSRPTEVVDGVEIASYRGDHVNGIEATLESREPDPERLVRAYFHSATTLNYARALLDGGFADLHSPHHWDLGFVRQAERRQDYEEFVGRILDALDFVEATGISDTATLKTVELFSSHEGLLLPYEEALTTHVPDAGFYNLGAHMLWIGDRTRQLDGAHVEYFRGIENPIGIKVGPKMMPTELTALLDRIEPDDRPGRVTLITRLGPRVRELLPELIEIVRATGRTVVWSCDPMHGNTEKTADGIKTRRVERILDELRATFEVHDAAANPLGGVHFELTGENVTECVGGPEELSEADLARSYETVCDPRLNYAQSLELAFLMARRLARKRKASGHA